MLTFAPPSRPRPRCAGPWSSATTREAIGHRLLECAYTTIQAGVNAASSGATIYVCAGTYTRTSRSMNRNARRRRVGQGVQTRAGGESVVSSVLDRHEQRERRRLLFNGRTSQVSVNSPTTLSGSSFRTTSSTATRRGAPHYEPATSRPEEPLRERLASSEAIQIKPPL